MSKPCSVKLSIVVVVLLAFTAMAALAGGGKTEPPPLDKVPGGQQDGGKVPIPPKQDDGKVPIPPKQDDGKVPIPPKQDDGKVPIPPKQDDGKVPIPPKDGKIPPPPPPPPPPPKDGKIPISPKDGKIPPPPPPPPPPKDGKIPIPPKDGKIPPPPPPPPPPKDGKIPIPPKDGKIPPPPPPPPPPKNGKIPPPQQQQQGIQVLPQWQSGMQWQVQSQNYQMQSMGKAEWSEPVKWDYEVVGQQQIQGQQCHVVQVSQQGGKKSAMTLYVSQKDLNLVQTDTVITVQGQQQTIQQQFSPGQMQSFYQLGPAPCQMPQAQQQLPPPAKPGQKAAPRMKSFRALVPTGGGMVFQADVKQTMSSISFADLKALLPSKAPRLKSAPKGNLYKIETEGPGVKSVFVIGTESVWPVYAETPTQKSWLLTGPR